LTSLSTTACIGPGTYCTRALTRTLTGSVIFCLFQQWLLWSRTAQVHSLRARMVRTNSCRSHVRTYTTTGTRGDLSHVGHWQIGFPGFGMFNTVPVGESLNIFYLHERSTKIWGWHIVGKLLLRSVFLSNEKKWTTSQNCSNLGMQTSMFLMDFLAWQHH